MPCQHFHKKPNFSNKRPLRIDVFHIKILTDEKKILKGEMQIDTEC